MRIVLRHVKSGQYYQQTENWVASPAEAHHFGTCAAAIDFVVTMKLEDVEIRIEFEDPKYNITLPTRVDPDKPRQG